MRVLWSPRSDRVYSSNAFLVLGTWNRIDDVNVLVDAGADPGLLSFLDQAPTGLGKRKVDLVALTHRHYDHVTMVQAVKDRYGAAVAGWGPASTPVERVVADGERLRFGDEMFEAIHTPGHTDDSVCYFGTESGALFVGDAPVLVSNSEGTFEPAFVAALRRLASLPVRTIYFGHGEPLTRECAERLAASLGNVERGGRAARGRRG